MLFNKYKDDYKQVQNLGPDGKLRNITFYDGEYYELPYDSRQFNRNKYICLAFAILILLIFFGAGLVNPDSSRTPWIVFPYLFIFLPVGYNIYGAFSLFGLQPKMERAQFDASIVRMKNSSIAIIAMTIINILLDVVFLIVNRQTVDFVIELSYMLLLITLIVVVIAFGKKYDKMFGGVILNSK